MIGKCNYSTIAYTRSYTVPYNGRMQIGNNGNINGVVLPPGTSIHHLLDCTLYTVQVHGRLRSCCSCRMDVGCADKARSRLC